MEFKFQQFSAIKLDSLGFPTVTRKGVLSIVNRIINKKLNNVKIDEDRPVGIKCVDKLMHRHSDLADLVTHSSVKPVRVDKVTDEVRDMPYLQKWMHTPKFLS
jgi:hypothetical protein